jgi:hypothetical protein
MIHGLTPSLAEGGKIKTGTRGPVRKSKAGNDWRPPIKLDHFLITGTRRINDDPLNDLEPDVDLVGALVEEGWADDDGKLRTIPIVLHSDDIEEVFPTCYAAYSGKRLACKGDGMRAERREIANGRFTGQSRQMDCPCELQDGKRCKAHGVLHCSIRVPGQAVAGSVHRWRTTSIISIQQLTGSLTQILTTVGVLQGLPLVLRVMPIQVAPDGRAATVYCCHVELRAKDLPTIQREALGLAQLRRELSDGLSGVHRQYRKMLQRPGDEPAGAAGEWAGEYHGHPDGGDDDERVFAGSADGAPAEVIPAVRSMPPAEMTDAQIARAVANGDPLPLPPTPTPPSKPTVTITTPASSKTVTLTDPGPKPQGGDPPARGRRRYQCARCGDLFHGDHRVDGVCLWCLWAEETGDVTEAPAGQGELPTEAQPTPSERLDAIWQLGLDHGLDLETMKAIWPRDEGETLTPSHDLADKAEMVISALIEDKERAEREAGAE